MNTSFIADAKVIFFFFVVVFASSSGGADGTKLFFSSDDVSGVCGGNIWIEPFLTPPSLVDVSLGKSWMDPRFDICVCV